ncbi:CrcB family protein [Cellulomonas sp. URHE0023]|uniref:CrcB family protein n=1 Tax=Cellulomonas sp. URHE0023 TaxID=1380354 RepID=UPI00047F4983|nr:CrcB family protein [Cellulomonas sp. URHE0023]
MTRPPHHDPRLIAVVALGGAVGTTARWAVTHAIGSSANGFPTATLVENVVGSFLLGALLEALLRRGAESRRGRVLRLGLGTGLLGGFTTFSALALELERLLAAGQVTTALVYAAASLVLGILGCVAGIALAARRGTA